LLAILSRDVLAAHPGAVIIADVKASQALFDEVTRLGGRPLMWKTGHSLIKDKMVETRALLAGEMSGHIFFADEYYGFDDALYAAVRLLRVICRHGLSLAQLRDQLPQKINTPEIRIDCADELKFEVMRQVAANLRADGADFDATDGVRVRCPSGWWLLRASNTQAVLVARAEAEDALALDSLITQIRHYLGKLGVKFDPSGL
jgi:phosphomannomutase